MEPEAPEAPVEPVTVSVSGWIWAGAAVSTGDNGEWRLALTGTEAQAPTLDDLKTALPTQVLATLADGTEKALTVTWTLPEALADKARLEATLENGYVLSENVPTPYVVLSLTLPEEPDEPVSITGWVWKNGEEALAEYNGEWYLNLSAGDLADKTEEEQKELLDSFTKQLPGKIQATLSNEESVEISLTWPELTLTNVKAEEICRFDAAMDSEYPLGEDVPSPCVFFTFGEKDSVQEWAWHLTLPGPKEDWTDDLLKAQLPDTLRVPGQDGEDLTVKIAWERSALQKEEETRFDAVVVKTDSEEDTADQVLLPSVFFTFTQPEVKYITDWEWVDKEGCEGFLVALGGQWFLSLGSMDSLFSDSQTMPSVDVEEPNPDQTAEEAQAQNLQALRDVLAEILPDEIRGTLKGEEASQALVKIQWDDSALEEEPVVIGTEEDLQKLGITELSQETDPDAQQSVETQWTLYPLMASVEEGYQLAEEAPELKVWLDVGGAEVYASYPGNRELITSEAELDRALAAHKVRGITPAGTTVNLFDYVASKDGAVVHDLTDKEPLDGSPYNVAKSSEWNKGINENRLLLFGDSIVGAGYWNNGAGAGRLWAQKNTNMKGIVLPTLTDGYPVINTAAASKPIANAESYSEGQLPFCIAWAEDEDKKAEGDTYKNAPALSLKVLDNYNGDASLNYLFDLSTNTNKRSYENVAGLFQVDENGYYYYDARRNFAEFNESKNSFILYDGPAIWRTDGGWDGNGFNGDRSLGNFYPFNTGKQVFDSIDTDKNCLSSSTSTSDTDPGLDGLKWGQGRLLNKATGQDILINHHMGMTMQVDFTQPENGKLNMGSSGKQDMVFQFSGDDDVWIFIDDVLVLDLGGIHSELYGTINFSTGEVVTGQSWRTGGLPVSPGRMPGDTITTIYDMFVKALGQEQADAIHWVTNDSGARIFPTGTDHSLKLFYLERGNYDSSLQMRFNLQPPLYHSIKKVDQNGDPLPGVTFELYAAERKNGDSPYAADYSEASGALASLTTGTDGKSNFMRTDGSPFSFTDRYHANGTLYYILKETRTAGGYRSLPNNIVLRYDPDTSMLVVANRYETGAYASFFSNINETGNLTYGQFDEGTGNIASSNTTLEPSSKRDGIIVAVPMLFESSSQKWNCLYGSNTEGYGAVVPAARTAEEWRRAVLKAALYQASDERWPEWRLTYNQNTGRLEGLLEDLPGRSDRYALNNVNGDMKMVYGVIEPRALGKLGITGNTSAELYDALERYVSQKVESSASAEAAIDGIVGQLTISGNIDVRDFSFLNTDQFQREFRSSIYIPNERRELRVQKVDEDGRGINGVEFTLTPVGGGTAVTGTTATVNGRDGMLIFRPGQPAADGYAQVIWGDIGVRYILKETSVPTGYERNATEIPVVVGIYSVYADAGSKDDGVTVMAGVGKLMQTMTKYAADDMVNITLRDITAIAQTQESGKFDLYGWQDDQLAGTQVPRSMNLHYGLNAVVDYGLHDEDGGKNIYPFFTTDEGFLRTRVEQNTDALESNLYEGSNNTANWDNLRGRHLTSLFSLQNTVVVTNKKTVTENNGRLRISKVVTGENLTNGDYTRGFTFTVSLKKADGSPLEGAYYYYGEQRAGYISDGGTLFLRHHEALTVQGLPDGTKWQVSEAPKSGWTVSPMSGVIAGEIKGLETVSASFTNYKGDIPRGSLTVTKTVAGNEGDRTKEFHFTVTLDDPSISGVYGEMTFEQGTARFTLKHGQSKKASDLPVDTGYTVVETEANQDGYTTVSNGETGKITTAGKTAAFTNTRNGIVTQKTGKLTVTKTVTGFHGDKTKAFTFVVTLSDQSINGKYGEMTFVNGRAEFTLKHGERKTAEGLPAGLEYTVREGDNEGYTVRKTDDTGVIRDGKTAYARFTNRKINRDTTPTTGDETRLGLWIGLSALCLLCAVAALIIGKRRKGRYTK